MTDTTKAISLATLGALVLPGTAARLEPRVTQHPSTCARPDAPEMPNLLAWVRAQVSNPRKDFIRRALKLPAINPTLVHLILIDSLCDAAARIINHSGGVANRDARLILLVRVGGVYVAEDPRNRTEERTRDFVFDGALKTILAQTGR